MQTGGDALFFARRPADPHVRNTRRAVVTGGAKRSVPRSPALRRGGMASSSITASPKRKRKNWPPISPAPRPRPATRGWRRLGRANRGSAGKLDDWRVRQLCQRVRTRRGEGSGPDRAAHHADQRPRPPACSDPCEGERRPPRHQRHRPEAAQSQSRFLQLHDGKHARSTIAMLTKGRELAGWREMTITGSHRAQSCPATIRTKAKPISATA